MKQERNTYQAFGLNVQTDLQLPHMILTLSNHCLAKSNAYTARAGVYCSFVNTSSPSRCGQHESCAAPRTWKRLWQLSHRSLPEKEDHLLIYGDDIPCYQKSKNNPPNRWLEKMHRVIRVRFEAISRIMLLRMWG